MQGGGDASDSGYRAAASPAAGGQPVVVLYTRGNAAKGSVGRGGCRLRRGKSQGRTPLLQSLKIFYCHFYGHFFAQNNLFFKYGEARGKIFNIGCRIFFLSFKDLTRCIFAVEKIKTVPCSNYRMYCISVLVQLHCQCCESECQCPVNICFKCVSGKSERAEQ